MQRIDAGRYEIIVGLGVIERLGDLVSQTGAGNASSYAIISDSNVAPLYGERVRSALIEHSTARSELFVVPAGEQSKSRREWSLITDAMLARGLGRDTSVIALGGGVVGDLAGFVAATFARGVPLIQVPTSLLAMVDASIGGKTGVDTPAGKNLVGAFHWPALVAIDPAVLATLPLAEWRGGFAEILKHGAIADAEHFYRAAAAAAVAPNVELDLLENLIAESAGIKARIVASDERESGARRALNVGHTIAHAIEQASGYRTSHGEAVAIGLVLESDLGELLGVTAPGTANALRRALSSAGLPIACPSDLPLADVLAATRVDKKSRNGRAQYAFLARIGAVDSADGRFSRPVSDDEVSRVIEGSRSRT